MDSRWYFRYVFGATGSTQLDLIHFIPIQRCTAWCKLVKLHLRMLLALLTKQHAFFSNGNMMFFFPQKCKQWDFSPSLFRRIEFVGKNAQRCMISILSRATKSLEITHRIMNEWAGFADFFQSPLHVTRWNVLLFKTGAFYFPTNKNSIASVCTIRAKFFGMTQTRMSHSKCLWTFLLIKMERKLRDSNRIKIFIHLRYYYSLVFRPNKQHQYIHLGVSFTLDSFF